MLREKGKISMSSATGTVVVTVGRKSKTLTLSSGSAKLRLATLRKTGKVKVTVRYVGTATTAASRATRSIKVVR